MTSARWELVTQIFDAALDQPESVRNDFVRRQCKDDRELEAEVLRLLTADQQAGSFLERAALTTVAARSIPPQPLSLIAAGSVVCGRFEIVRLIGQGGMGQVYEALDLELKARVALKAIRPEISSDPRVLSRFRREVQFTRRVTHPNVCRTFDIERHISGAADGIVGGITFLTMELLEGETLADLLRREGRLTTAAALPLVLQMVEALSAAHSVGIVHRDFKPSNVLLVPWGSPASGGLRVVVTDFGLARALVPDGHISADHASTSLTGNQALMGTLTYMAPEQFERGEATVASDIYSLGLVMYEMVTGQRPFADPIPFAEAARRLKHAAPSPKTLVPELDGRWEVVIGKCLEAEPQKRFETARQVAESWPGSRPISGLDSLTSRSAHPAMAQYRASSWRPRIFIIAVCFMLLLALLGVFLRYYIQRPSIKFAERDWILVTDFTNQTGEKVFDRVVRDLTVHSLSQSSFVNIVPRLSALEAAKRTGLNDVNLIDDKLGKELCLRENYKALLTGNIFKQGSGYTIAMKVQVPGRNSPAISLTESMQSPDEIFSAIDRIATRLRQALGEPLSKIESSTKILAHVTTSSLDALQRYSIALDLYGAREYERSINLASDAVERDPDFSMAHLLLARTYEQLGNDAQSEKEFAKASANLGRASERERHTILAAKYASDQQNEKAAEEYQHLLDIYPDDVDALRHFAIAAYYAGHPERGIDSQKRALALSPNDPGCYDYLMELLVRTNQFSDALGIFEQARSHNVETVSFRFLAALAAWGNEDLNKAQQLLDIPAHESTSYTDLVGKLYLGKLLAYRGHMREAIESFRSGLVLARRPGFEEWTSVFHYQLARVELAQGNINAASSDAGRYAELVKPFGNAGSLERAGSLAVDLMDLKSAKAFAAAIEKQARTHRDSFAEMELHTLEGEIALAQGHRRQAVSEERKAVDFLTSYEPLMALGEACEQERDWNCSIQAYVQYLQQKGAVLRHDIAFDWAVTNYRLARVYVASGDRKDGIEYCQRFLALVSSADSGLPAVVRATRDLEVWTTLSGN
ncbi:MAG TPA: protein kinase [Candidatus Sulfotelmatobacter sp.]